MNTALNLMNLTPDTPAPAPYRDTSDANRVQQSTSKDTQDNSEQDSESSFARILESESGSGKKPVDEKSASGEGSDATASSSEKKSVTDAEKTVATSDSGALQTAIEDSETSLQATEADPADVTGQVITATDDTDSDELAEGEAILQLPTEAKNSTPKTAEAAVARTVETATTGRADNEAAVAPGSAVPVTDNSRTESDSVVQSPMPRAANSIPVSAKPESFPAAGKDLPASGKNLPSGFFPQGVSDQDTANKLTDQKIPLFQGMEMNTVATGRINPAMDFSAESMWRTLVGGNAQATPDNGSAPQAANPAELLAATATSPLAASADKTGIGSRSLLSPLLENTASTLGFHITAEAGSHDWNQQISSRIRWMGNVNMSSAELKLHPAELGTVEVKISTEDDQTRVSFVTSNPQTRELIESSLPRLRELLGDSGLQLQQGDVSHRDQAGQAKQEATGGGSAETLHGDELDSNQPAMHITRNSTSQIDHYV